MTVPRLPADARVVAVAALVMAVLGAVTAGCGRRATTTEAPEQAAQPAGTTAGAPSGPPVERVPPERTNIRLNQRAAWRGLLAWSDDCEDAFQATHVGEDGGVAVHTLSGNVSLVEVLCASGAYQPSHVVFRLDERSAAPKAMLLTFDSFVSEDGTALTRSQATEIWGETSLRDGATELTVLAVARQTADCGVWTRYDVSGDAPQLIEVRSGLPCPARAAAPAIAQGSDPPPGWRLVPLQP
jgi:hypothetical protein